jgi:CheY-like chemotaxis protein
LVIEDNALNRELAMALLTELGIETEVAGNGDEGIRMASAQRFDLILMDIQMPEMDGLTAARLIRAKGPTRNWLHPDASPADVPIIALTAHASDGDYQRSLEAGMNDHLTKPIDVYKLRQILTRWLPAGTPLSTQSAERAARAEGADDDVRCLPDALPPFDLALALECCNGNGPLLRRLICRFAEDHEQSAPRLYQQIEDGSHAEAEVLAHNLKSAAATLGLPALSQASRALEDALRHGAGREELRRLVSTLDARLAPALAASTSIGSAFVASREAPSATSTSTAAGRADQQPTPFSPAARESLDQLAEQLKRNSLTARETLGRLRTELLEQDRYDHIARLAEQINQLDYPGALATLEGLISDGISDSVSDGISDGISKRPNT